MERTGSENRNWSSWWIAALLWGSVVAFPESALAIGGPRYVDTARSAGAFPLVQGTDAAPLAVDPDDWPGVVRAARDLRDDVTRVTGLTPELQTGVPSGPVIIIGTVGKSRVIDRLIRDRKIDVSDSAGKWESFVLQTVADPLPGMAQAVVIAGSDKRGTIYGIYDLSEQIGVSPWYWWQDAMPDRKAALFVRAGQ